MRKYNEEMDKMQQEAVRRMQEMQSRGKPASTPKVSNSSQNAKFEQKHEQESHNKPVPVYNEADNCLENNQPKQSSFFESIFHDKERSLILLLLLLLSTEKTDTGIILALVYLII